MKRVLIAALLAACSGSGSGRSRDLQRALRVVSIDMRRRGRVPALSAIKAMSGEAVYLALTSGSMKTRAEGLSTPQIFALLGYIAPTGGAQTTPVKFDRTCKGDAAFKPPRMRRGGTAGARA